ncbi:hypothetical protein K4F52_003155 [Lecanicillium sp. MT-2017a]|nr:hypothetical protein K4F52_003155 [Lecanicillium sp. MT-2017a]
MPDRDLLESRLAGKGDIFEAMQKVSFMTSSPFDDTQTVFFPIWLECARHRCGPQRRSAWLRQLLRVCFLDYANGIESTADAFLAEIVNNAMTFGLSLTELSTDSRMVTWILGRTLPEAMNM